MAMRIRRGRRRGVALVLAMFTLALLESRLELHADQWLPLWDKPVHALTAAGLVLTVSPRRDRSGWTWLGIMALGIAWEIAQFEIQPFAGVAPIAWAVDTAGDLFADGAGAFVALAVGARATGIRIRIA